MKRLTETGCEVINRIDVTEKMVYKKLAAYEDTGLTPEQITALQEENARLRERLDNAAKERSVQS
jgi:transposase